MKKKRTKKYNPTLKFQQLSKPIARNYKILDITAVDVFVYFRDKEIKPKLLEANMLNEVRYKWQIMAGVVCRDQFSKEYIKTETIITGDEYFTFELSDYLTELQKNLWERANPLHRLTQFWLASPTFTEFEEKTIMAMLTDKGAFSKFITEYEYANKVSKAS